MRRIGAAPGGSVDPDAQPRVNAFQHELQQLGWTNGNNVRIDYRWSAGSAEDIRRNAAEIIALDPEVIITTGASVIARLLQRCSRVPTR